MPKLPEALGTPDPNGIAASDAAGQAASAMQSVAPEPAQPYDPIETLLDGTSSLYARFGQGGPPRLTDDVASSDNGLATAPYGADVASGSGYGGNALPSPLDLSAFASDLPQNSGTNSNSPVEATSPGVPVVLPNGSRVPANSTTGFLMSPVADLSSVAAAGRNVGNTYLAMLNNPEAAESANSYLYASLYRHLSQGGTFDYQRQGNPITGFTQLRQFRDVSNFNVGLFSQQAGLTLERTLWNAALYARFRSSNAKPNQPSGLDAETELFIKAGYQAGASGVFGPAAH